MTLRSSVPLPITSGNGPAECRLAVAGVLDVMRREAAARSVSADVRETPDKPGLKSAVVVLGGAHAPALAQRWCGTIRWRARSPLRPQHKRTNWFIGVFALPRSAHPTERLRDGDILVETFRAGGPGGQHQNTTDSAVRATHEPTGLSAVAREDRSQHRNRSMALARLQNLLGAQASAEHEAQKAAQNQLHRALERGNPLRCFTGHDFREEREASGWRS